MENNRNLNNKEKEEKVRSMENLNVLADRLNRAIKQKKTFTTSVIAYQTMRESTVINALRKSNSYELLELFMQRKMYELREILEESEWEEKKIIDCLQQIKQLAEPLRGK